MGINVGIMASSQSNFVKIRSDVTYPELVRESASKCLDNANMDVGDLDAIVFALAPDALIGVGQGERWCVEALGAQGKPFMRVNNGGATGLTALEVAYNHVASGMFEVVLVAGADRVSESVSAQSILNKMWDVGYERPYPLNTITMLALSAVRYMHLYGATEEDFARVTVRNRENSALNPHAHLRTLTTIKEVMATRMLSWPLKLGDLCPSSTGSAAVLVVSEEYARKHRKKVAWIRGIGQNNETIWMGDRVGPESAGDHGDAVGLETAFSRAYRQAGITKPSEQLQVAELYSPFSSVEYHVIEAAGLSPRGHSYLSYRDGEFSRAGRGVVVNPSGGVLTTNPIAVTGLVRAIEGSLQVLGEAGDRQVEGANVAAASAIGGDHQFYSAVVIANHLERI